MGGDFDGDGVGDMAVGARRWHDTRGRAVVLPGSLFAR